MNRLEKLERHRISQQKYRELNPEKNREAVRKYAASHPDVIKRRNNKWNLKLIGFKGKRFAIPTVNRKGICVNCTKSIKQDEIKRTVLHHFTYDHLHPDWYVIEFCNTCHIAEHFRLRQLGIKVPEINKHMIQAKEKRGWN